MQSFRLVARMTDSREGAVRQGTGWLLWPDVVVTALHVVGEPGGAGQWLHDKLKDPKDAYTLRTPGGEAISLSPIAYDPRADVALLQLPDGAPLPESAFAVLAPVPAAVGEPWHALGFPAFQSDGLAIPVGGVVSHVSGEIASTSIQLFVDQGTSVTWGGISGSAAQNAWGEVIGVVLQTVSGIATCNAAPAEAAARLVRMRAEIARTAEQLAGRLDALGADGITSVLGALRWAALAGKDTFAAAPAKSLAQRIAEAGPQGMELALDAIGKIEAERGAARSDDVQDTEPLTAAAAPLRPTPQDLLDLLDALADAGGSASVDDLRARALDTPKDAAAGARGIVDDVRARLRDMPAEVLTAAANALLDNGWRGGTRGAGAVLTLTAQGADRAARKDHVRALLKLLLGGDAMAEGDLAGKAGVGPRALHRALVYAATLGAIVRRPGPTFAITDAGRALFAGRATQASAAR